MGSLRSIDRIIFHCSATRPDFDLSVDELRRWHVDGNGWRDIGYHYFIKRGGAVFHCRPVPMTGAHVRGHNRGSIGVCLEGGFGSGADDAFDDHFTAAQRDAALKLITDLEHCLGLLALHGHNEFAAKACPGFRVSSGRGLHSPARLSA